MKNLLVTGGTGCAGYGVLKYLEYLNCYNVYVLTRKNNNQDNGIIKYVHGDLTNKKSLEEAFDDYNIEVVWHLAGAVDPYMRKEQFYKVNVEGTRNLMEVAIDKGVKTFNFTSSVAVYGIKLRTPVTEDHKLAPVGHYAKSKLQAEKIILELAEEFQIKGGITRLPLILGKRDRHFYRRVGKLLKWHLLPIMGDRKHKISIIHPYDIAQGLEILTKKGKKITPYNVKSFDISFKRLIETIELEVKGKTKWRIALPYPLLHFGALLFEIGSKILSPTKEPLFNREYATMMGKEWTFDISKIEKLGFKPQMDITTTIKDLLREEIITPRILPEATI